MDWSYLTTPRLYHEIRWHLDEKKYRKVEAAIKDEFDQNFYLKTYPAARRSGIPAIRHFILIGDKRNYDPNALFSTRRYAKTYGDVRPAKLNAFYHYLEFGRKENRTGYVSDRTGLTIARPAPKLAPPPAPSVSVWADMPARVVEGEDPSAVDVIVPVYKGLEHTAACLRSVLTATSQTRFECLVVNDASPDPKVSELLSHLAGLGLIRLIENDGNLGFVASVNRGMSAHPERDVVLLNSDAVVFDGWLDRIVAHTAADPSIATATPFSNNATICSYPRTAKDNPDELEVSTAELAAMAGEHNAGVRAIEVPTGVGYCMWIRRSALDAVGLFDAETFGLGYGEESDFCMRALKAGWRNVLVPDAFVLHYGSVSFGADESHRSREAQRILARRHPDYALRVHSHIAADPALAARVRLDAARLARALAFGPDVAGGPAGRTGIVFVVHTWGGGIESYLDRLRDALAEAGRQDLIDASLVMRCMRGGAVLFEAFGEGELPELPNLASLNAARHQDVLRDVLAALDPSVIHVNSLAGLRHSEIAEVTRAITAAGAPVWHVWHDHQPLTPRVDFLDQEGRMVDESDEAREDHEAMVSTEPLEWVRIADWRDTFRRYFEGVDRVLAPSEAAAERARRIVPEGRVVVEAHPEPDLLKVKPLKARRSGRDAVHVGVVGAIGVHKGANVLQAMHLDMDARELPIRIDVVGYTSARALTDGGRVKIHGKYASDSAALATLKRLHPDIVFISSVWPETYVFTLSLAMALHLPVVCFDIGAQAERVRAYGRGVVLDRMMIEDPVAVNEALLGLDIDKLWSIPPGSRATAATSLAKLWREGPPAAIVHPLKKALVA